jgi:hypothetical protein
MQDKIQADEKMYYFTPIDQEYANAFPIRTLTDNDFR